MVVNPCTGCSACKNICPQAAIEMMSDEEGFLYPHVDKNRCNSCGLCASICPIGKSKTIKDKQKVYGCINKDFDVKMKSASGGMFSILADYVLDKSGVVFGAALNDSCEVQHMMINDKKDLHKLRGSKYVQSNIGETFAQAKEELEKERLVLFTGTPCQIAGLKSFLLKSYDNLIAVELICYGVPSPAVFRRYMEETLAANGGGDIKSISFRNKDESWRDYNFIIETTEKTINRKGRTEDLYIKGFLSRLFNRPSCMNCDYRGIKSTSDIIIGDYWGVATKFPELNDDKGVSLVIINTKKGRRVFLKLADKMDVVETTYEHAAANNLCLLKSAMPHKNREEFFEDFKEGKSVIDSIEKYL